MAGRATSEANTVRRASAGTDLSDAEIAALSGINATLPVLPADGNLEMTEAELAILEAKGATVAIGDSSGRFEKENPLAVEDGSVLFKIGEGDAQFTGVLNHVSKDGELINLWHPVTGVKRPLRRVHLMYYIAKGWLPRPPANVTVPLPSIPCGARWVKCRKVLLSPVDAENHMRRAHSDEWKAAKAQREIDRQDRIDALLERLSMQGAQSGGVDMLALATILRDAVSDGVAQARNEFSNDAVASIAPEAEPAGVKP